MSLLGDLVVGITGDMTKLAKDLDASSKALDQWGNKAVASGKKMSQTGQTLTRLVTGPIVAVGAGVLALATKTAAYADELADLEAQTGLNTDTLQEYRYVCDQAGVASDTVANAVMGLTRRLPQLRNEGSLSAQELGKLGLTFEDLEEMKPEEIVDVLIEKLAEMPDVLERNSIGSKLFGGAWIEMAPVLAEGATRIDQLREEAHDLGFVMSGEALDAADEYRQEWVKLKNQFYAVFRELGVNLMPMLKNTLIPFLRNTAIPLLEKIIGFVVNVLDWFGKLSPAAQTAILGIVAAVALLGPVLTVIGNITQAVGFLTQGLGLLTSALGAIAASPVALLITALAGAAVGITYVYSEVRQAGRDMEEFEERVDAVGDSVTRMSYALTQGVEPAALLSAAIGKVFDELEGQDIPEGKLQVLTMQLLALKKEVLDLPIEEMAARWESGVDEIIAKNDDWIPGLRESLGTARDLFESTTEVATQSAEDAWKRVEELLWIGEQSRLELERITNDLNRELYSQGFTPAYTKLTEEVVAVTNSLTQAIDTYEKNSLEYVGTLDAAKLKHVELIQTLQDLTDKGFGNSALYRAIEELGIYLQVQIEIADGTITAEKAVERQYQLTQQALERAAKVGKMSTEERLRQSKAIAAQLEMEARADADLAATQDAIVTGADRVGSTYDDLVGKINRLRMEKDHAVKGSLEEVEAQAELDAILLTLVGAYDQLIDHQGTASASLQDLILRAKNAGAVLKDETTPAVKEAAREWESFDTIIRTWRENLEPSQYALASFVTGIKSTVVSTLSDLSWQLLTFYKTTQDEQRDHLQRMKDIAESFADQETQATKTRDRAKEDALKTYNRRVEDLEYEKQQRLSVILATDYEARKLVEDEFNERMKEAHLDYTRTIEDADTTYTRNVEDLTQDRIDAQTEEKETYEENRTTIPKILGGMFTDAVTEIAQSGIKSTIEGIVNDILRIPTAAEEAGKGLAEGLAVNTSGIASAAAGIVTALSPLLAAIGLIALVMDFVTGGDITSSLNRFITEEILGQHYGAGTWKEEALPSYAGGGIVSGRIGEPQLAVVHGGEPIGAAGLADAMDYGRFADAVAAGVLEGMLELRKSGRGQEIILEVDKKRLGQVVYPEIIVEARRQGVVLQGA